VVKQRSKDPFNGKSEKLAVIITERICSVSTAELQSVETDIWRAHIYAEYENVDAADVTAK